MTRPLLWSPTKDEFMIESSRGPGAATKGAYFYSAIEPYLPPLPKNFLSIGAGAGDAEIFLAKKLNCPFGFQDFSNSLTSIFQDKARKEGLSTLETVVGRFEDCPFQYRYDVILSFHAWYYISVSSIVMKKLRDILAPGGRALIVLHRKDNFVFELNPYRGKEQLEISADNLFEAAKPYFQTVLHSWVDYWPPNTFFINDEITQKGRTLFRFLLDRESECFSPEEIEIFKRHVDKFTDSNGTKISFGIVELNRAD
jgi:SAM-dependent methyltransferase